MARLRLSRGRVLTVVTAVVVMGVIAFLVNSARPLPRAPLRTYDKVALEKIEAGHLAWLAAGGCAPDANGNVDPERMTFPKDPVPEGAEQGSFFIGNFRKADFSGKNLRCASFIGDDLENADFSGADLRGAFFNRSNLRGVSFSNADLRGAIFHWSDLKDANYSPKHGTRPQYLAYAYNLDFLKSGDTPAELMALKKTFGDNGYIDAKKQVIAAVNRWEKASDFHVPLLEYTHSAVQAFRYVAFDLTCEYGANPARPLVWIAVLWVLFALIYAAVLISPLRSSLFLQVWIVTLRDPRSLRLPRQKTLAAFRIASFFSGRNAIRLGFAQFDLGKWLRMLQRHDYDIVATGWMRTVAAAQALLSQYLIALSVLSVFGFPFDT